MLSGHFAAKHGRHSKAFSKDAIRTLQSFPWPGNVRQLRNIVERLVLTAPVRLIESSHLSAFLTGKPHRTRPSLAGMTLDQLESELISQTLQKASGNRTEAARLLGISRRALQYKLKRASLIARCG